MEAAVVGAKLDEPELGTRRCTGKFPKLLPFQDDSDKMDSYFQ